MRVVEPVFKYTIVDTQLAILLLFLDLSHDAVGHLLLHVTEQHNLELLPYFI